MRNRWSILVTILGGICLLASTAQASEARKATKVVKPVYPAIALEMRVHGAVIVEAVVGADGNVNNVIFVSGPSLLKTATIDCVKQWHYSSANQTTLIPVEVDFKLPE